MSKVVAIRTDLLINTADAEKSINEFTAYAEKKISQMTPKLDFKFDEAAFSGVINKVEELFGEYKKLGEVQNNAVAPKTEEVQKAEKELEKLENRVKQVNTSFDNAKTECEKYEQQLKDATLSEQQKININEKLIESYSKAATEAKRFMTAMEKLRDATNDSGAILNQTKLINNLSVTYEDLRVKAKNAKQTLADGVTAKGTKIDVNNFAQLNKQIETSKNKIQDYSAQLKKKSLTESEQRQIMVQQGVQYALLIQLLNQKQEKLNSVNKSTEQGTAKWNNYQSHLSNVSKEISKAKTALSNLNSEMSKEQSINIQSIDSDFKNSIVSLEQDIQRVIIANRSLNNSIDEKQKNLTAVTNKYSQLKGAYTEQIAKLKSMQQGLNSESENYKKLQQQINKTESALSKLETQEQRNVSTMKNSIERQKQAIEKEQQRQAELKETLAAQKEMQASLGDVIATYSQFYLVLNQVRNAIQVHQDVDKALTETRKVAELTKEEMREYQAESLNAANGLGLLQTELINATTEFTRLGVAFEEAKEFGEIASMGAVVGDIDSADEVSNYLIATIQGFKELEMTAGDARKVVDMFNEVANNTSINFQALGEGTKRFAASMSETGNTIEESLGLLTAGYDVTRDAERIARALNTIGLRMRGINDEGEEQLELVPKMEETFTKYGINMNKVNEDGLMQMKSTYELLGEIAGVWDTLDDYAKTNLLEAIAGKQQANAAAAIIGNWQTVEKTVGLAMDSTGSAATEYGYYMESMEAATNQFQNAVSGLYQHIISSDSLIELINIATSFIQTLSEVDPLVYQMVAAFAAGQAASWGLSNALNGSLKAFKSFKTIISAFTSLTTGAVTATTLLNAALGAVGLIPIVAALGVGIVGLTAKISDYTSKASQLERQQNSFNEKAQATQSAFSGMDSAIKTVTGTLDEYGNVITKIDEVEFYRHVNALKELYPELRNEINETVASYEDKYEAMLKLEELTDSKLAEEQLSVMQMEQDMINELVERRTRLSESIQDNKKELAEAMDLYPEQTSLIDAMKFAIEDEVATLAEMDALLKDADVTMQGHAATLEDLGYKYSVVNGQIYITKLSSDDLSNSFNLQDYCMQTLINDVIDLTTADGVLARAFIELSNTGQISAQTLDLLSQFFDQATIAAFTSADAVISYANANNLSTHQILSDSNSWIAGSKQKIKQHIAEMEVLKQHALANEQFHYLRGETGEAQNAAMYAKQIQDKINAANSELKAYEALTNKLNKLSTPTSSSSKPSTVTSTYSPSSGSSSSSKDSEKAIDYAKKFAAELRRIADIENEIDKLNSKQKYAKSDQEKFSILNELAEQYRKKVAALKDYQSKLNAELAKVSVGSDEYYTLRDLLADVEQQILDNTLAQQDFNKEIMELKKEIEEFDLTAVGHEISVLTKLLDNENLTLEERKKLTNDLAAAYDKQAKETKDMINLLKKEQSQYSQNSSEWRELQEKIWDYELDLMDIEKDKLDLIKDINDEIIKAQEERVQKEIDLINEKLDAELAAIDERIAALKKEKEEQEDIDKRKEIQDEIDKLQIEYDALSADDSLWAKKRKYEIEQAKKEKEEELRKLQEEKEYQEKLEALENEKKKLQEEANAKIDKLNGAIESLKDGSKGIDTVLKDVEKSLTSALRSVSDTICDALTSGGQLSNQSVATFSAARSVESSSPAVFNFTFNGVDKNSGGKIANDFITALQSKGYKLR